MAGEVVGINSQIYSRTGGYMGLSFSIPIDVAVKIKDDLVKFGKVTRGRIGVSVQGVNKDLADSFGLDKPKGALVGTVEKGGPAEKAGLQSGDVILAVDGKAVEQSIDLPRIIGETKPGTTLGPPSVAQGRDARRPGDRRRDAGRESGRRRDRRGSEARQARRMRCGR